MKALLIDGPGAAVMLAAGWDPLPIRRARAVLAGRAAECARLDRLLAEAHAGQSAVLVLRGEPGIGKSALLEYAAEHAEDCRVLRAVGVEWEMELPFAGLHQLCAGLLDGRERLPAPQRDALATAFGLSSGAQPDRFLVGLAVLSLLSDAAAEHPLVCLVDDVQWLDRSSAQVLAFVARRLAAESVVLLFAEREPRRARGAGGAARAAGRADCRTPPRGSCSRRSSPLLWTSAFVTGYSPRPMAIRLRCSSCRANSRRRAWRAGLGSRATDRCQAGLKRASDGVCSSCPPRHSGCCSLAAADPTGEPALLVRASEELGVPIRELSPAEADGLVEFGAQVTFRHPLLRSAIYRAARPEERRAAHRALATATDPEVDPDRRAWHRAHATAEPDEDVALELERSAARARARGGLAAAAAFLERSAALTPDPARRAQRELEAAASKQLAGASREALRLLASAAAGPLDEFDLARLPLLHGQIEVDLSRGADALPLLLDAAQQLEPLDVPAFARCVPGCSTSRKRRRQARPGNDGGRARSPPGTTVHRMSLARWTCWSTAWQSGSLTVTPPARPR